MLEQSIIFIFFSETTFGLELEKKYIKIKISVVIGTFNQAESLKKVLPVYENQLCSKDLFEVILIDSNSADNTHEFLNEYNPNYNFKYNHHASPNN